MTTRPQSTTETPERIWISSDRSLKWTDYAFDGGIEYQRAAASAAPVVDNKLVSDLIKAVNRSKSINSDGEWWLDMLKAGGRVRALLAKAGQDESCKWRVALGMYQKTHDDLVALRQRVEETIIVAKTDVDEGGGITAYHFKTGAIHRLLAEARQGDGPESTESNYVRNAAATAAEQSDEENG